MGKTLRIVTHNLNSRTVGQIVEMTALDGAKRDGGQSETFRKSDSAMPISAGEYPGSKIQVNLVYDPQGAATEETLEIPIDFVVEE